jgi:hypothetical protein
MSAVGGITQPDGSSIHERYYQLHPQNPLLFAGRRGDVAGASPYRRPIPTIARSAASRSVAGPYFPAFPPSKRLKTAQAGGKIIEFIRVRN